MNDINKYKDIGKQAKIYVNNKNYIVYRNDPSIVKSHIGLIVATDFLLFDIAVAFKSFILLPKCQNQTKLHDHYYYNIIKNIEQYKLFIYLPVDQIDIIE